MAAATITGGTEYHGKIQGPGISMHIYQITLAATASDGVTVAVPCAAVVGAHVSCNESDMIVASQITASWSGTTVTVYGTDTATLNAGLVSLLVFAID